VSAAVGAAVPSFGLGWLFLFEVTILLLWYGRRSPARSPFARRFGQLIALLLSETNAERGVAESRGQDTIRALHRFRALSRLSGSARRWRGQLEVIYTQGYQAASETISSTALVQAGLMQAAVEALQPRRTRRGANLPTTKDPVVVLAYGLGAWPAGADLTSLEQLLGELGTSQGELRHRFDGVTRAAVTANKDREFSELAGASFVLGASARIVEAATAPATSVPPPASGTARTRTRSTQPRTRPPSP
jgi:hypothetical protein